MQRVQFEKYADSMMQLNGFNFTSGNYKNKAAYDSALALGIKHNWAERQLIYKNIELNEKFAHSKTKFFSVFVYTLTHSFPQMFFLYLTLFALILKIIVYKKKAVLFCLPCYF